MYKIYLIIAAVMVLAGCSSGPGADAVRLDVSPRLYPQIAGATLPVNIAAPAFEILDKAERYHTMIGIVGQAPAISVSGKMPEVAVGLSKWHKLLSEAAGQSIFFRVSALTDGEWSVYEDVVCPVSEYPIDEYLAYRLLYPGYELWNEMGIYQRNLSNYDELPIIQNRDIGMQCVNCHSFAGNDPSTMMMHVRGAKGGTIVAKDGKMAKVNPKCPALDNGAVYPSWHPSGRYIAFSSNEIQQFFHSSGTKTIEVSDLAADMTVYDVERGISITSPALSGDEWMESFPNWSVDGRTLYFTRAKGYKKGEPLQNIRYDLCSIAFDPDSCLFGDSITVVIDAISEGKSVSFPRVSPDGRWLLYTLSDYGNFSIWHPESDLWLLDLTTGESRPVDEVNSEDVDSYHSWSKDGRWIVFSSKRMDGLWARPYIAAFDAATGRFGLPFALPQREARFYDNLTLTYNIPELITAPVTYPLTDLANQ